MNHLRLLGPLALLVSGLLYGSAGLPLSDADWSIFALAAAGFLLVLAFWRGDKITGAWHSTSAWLQSAALLNRPPAQRVTIRIRCQR
ncbi:MAG: hypothetical protein JWP20_1297 [Roseomonas sp.]|jgi:hypothetical protein|nr:hypothetical protein [Roseomonas sp.]